jgi:hypothetical protein
MSDRWLQDAQDRAEALDDDKLPGEFPPDRPTAVEEDRVTPAGEWLPETLAERVEREEPEPLAGGDGTADALQASDRVGDQLPGPVAAPAEEVALHEEGDAGPTDLPAGTDEP